MKIKLSFIFLIFFLTWTQIESFQDSNIVVETNKELFGKDELVKIDGFVEGGIKDTLVLIKISSLNNGKIIEKSTMLDEHGHFYANFTNPLLDGSDIFELIVSSEIDGKILTHKQPISFTSKIPTVHSKSPDYVGGCLIATATYGSELAPQVQQLRELRDGVLLQTASGSTFMTSFNAFYYSFSPTIADWERQNHMFKYAVKMIITPLVLSLSILNYVDLDSEIEVLFYGSSIIALNLGLYMILPVSIIVWRCKSK